MNDRKQTPGRELHELAPLYALGALDPEEKQSFEEHLRTGCAACEAELRSYGDVAVALSSSVAVKPPLELRERLLARISHAPRGPGILLQHSGVLISRSQELAWQALAPGIEVKPLYVDAVRRYNTCLVRMEAGAHYPSHRHRDIEEVFLLSGDLHVEGQVMRSGDYCRADSGTIHGETFTDSGAVFLLMASQQNEIVA